MAGAEQAALRPRLRSSGGGRRWLHWRRIAFEKQRHNAEVDRAEAIRQADVAKVEALKEMARLEADRI